MDKELKSWMKENNFTEEDFDYMWEFCAVFEHPTIKILYDQNVSWRGLNTTVIKSLPEIYDKMLRKELFEEE